jgi:hypothetical protein
VILVQLILVEISLSVSLMNMEERIVFQILAQERKGDVDMVRSVLLALMVLLYVLTQHVSSIIILIDMVNLSPVMMDVTNVIVMMVK